MAPARRQPLPGRAAKADHSSSSRIRPRPTAGAADAGAAAASIVTEGPSPPPPGASKGRLSCHYQERLVVLGQLALLVLCASGVLAAPSSSLRPSPAAAAPPPPLLLPRAGARAAFLSPSHASSPRCQEARRPRSTIAAVAAEVGSGGGIGTVSSGPNMTNAGLLDLAGFRAGLDETYRLKRKSAAAGPDRKPWGYWKDISQIKASVEEFWAALNITSSAIPNEMLLRLYDYHGLRHAIYKQGGRETLAYLLGVDFIPGDFRLALDYPEIQALVKKGIIQPYDASQLQAPEAQEGATRRLIIGPRGGAVIMNERLRGVRFPPRHISEATGARARAPAAAPSVAAEDGKEGDGEGQARGARLGWRPTGEGSSEGSGPKRTAWSYEKLAEECYLLAEEHSQALQLPPLFFPKISDLVLWRRANMIHTIRRYGGYEAVVQSLGFIPFSQWNYFCRFYLLMKDLKQYLDEAEGGLREMPTLRDVKRAGFHRLYSEVQRNGGRKLVAARIGLPLKPGSGEHGKFATMISYGTFDFDFGVALMEYIMNKCWLQHPRDRAYSRDKVNLFLPTAEELVADNRKDLLEKIIKYGGFENVARRLQLGFKS